MVENVLWVMFKRLRMNVVNMQLLILEECRKLCAQYNTYTIFVIYWVNNNTCFGIYDCKSDKINILTCNEVDIPDEIKTHIDNIPNFATTESVTICNIPFKIIFKKYEKEKIVAIYILIN